MAARRGERIGPEIMSSAQVFYRAVNGTSQNFTMPKEGRLFANVTSDRTFGLQTLFKLPIAYVMIFAYKRPNLMTI